MKEKKVMTRLNSPNLIKLYDAIESSNNFYLISELCETKNLYDYIKSVKLVEEPFAINII